MFFSRHLSGAAGARAEDVALLRQEGPAQQGALAPGAAEALLGGVPVLPVVRHLALVDAFGERRGWRRKTTTAHYFLQHRKPASLLVGAQAVYR